MKVEGDEILESLRKHEYDKLLETYNDDFDKLTDIGISLIQLKNPKAEAFFRRAIEINNTGQAHHNLALFLSDVKKDNSEAEKEYKKAQKDATHCSSKNTPAEMPTHASME